MSGSKDDLSEVIDAQPGPTSTRLPQSNQNDAGSGDETGQEGGDDATRAPEEESQSQLPGDPRPPHQLQPPTEEQY